MLNYTIPLLIIIIIQIIFFFLAYIYKTDKLTDLAYGLTFVFLSFYLLVQYSGFHPGAVIATALISIWGVRLAGYLFTRVHIMKKDVRLDGIRDNFFRFGMFWMLQAASIFIIMLPTINIMTSPYAGFTFLTVLGILAWLKGFIIETLSDMQKFSFKNKGGKFITTGFWRYSRHPNYWGEILMWWGIFIISIPYIGGLEWVTIASPLLITFLLIHVTGIPRIEKRYDSKFGKDKAYQRYKKKTSILIPWFPKKSS